MKVIVIGDRELWQLPVGRHNVTVMPPVHLPRQPHRGCYEAHRAAWRALDGETLIIEDDAIVDRIPITPGGCDVHYLGGQPIGWRPRTGTHPVAGCDMLARSHAYIVCTDRARDALLVTSWTGAAWDTWITWRAGLQVSLTWPPTAGQASGLSLCTGIVEPERWFCPTLDRKVRT